ncbi:hypothetical protein SAY87_029358 [Trapa incisa]|uniref:Uncharacterized protein n=1 Tax=Trapa incisa TaxID=236973 RepID=A0AAN7KAX4_9MYRT|nr:hypothetical protein SAY87_029358 [Trapa incisa]
MMALQWPKVRVLLYIPLSTVDLAVVSNLIHFRQVKTKLWGYLGIPLLVCKTILVQTYDSLKEHHHMNKCVSHLMIQCMMQDLMPILLKYVDGHLKPGGNVLLIAHNAQTMQL